MISDDKVGPKGVRVRCKKCGNVIPVRRPVENGAVAAEQPALAPTSTPIPGGLDVELGQAFDHAFGEGATGADALAVGAAGSSTPIPAAAPASGASFAAQLPDEDESPSLGDLAAPSRTPAPATPPAATEWYVAIGQAQVGPLPLEDVRRKWEVADVGPDSLVWRPGMGDWAPLSSVADLAAYLAPFPVAPRQSRTPAPAPVTSAHRAERSSTPVPTPAPGDVSWKPVGASALAALASEEIATRSTPEPRPATARAPAGAEGVRTLVEKMDLPDGGGVDPTGAIPLPMKALETTGEHKMERISSVARGAEQIRHKRSAARGVAIAVVALLVLGGGAAAWVTGLIPGSRPAQPAPVVAVAPAPVEAKPVQPAPEPAVAAAPPAAQAQPAPAQPAPVEPAPAQAAPSPAVAAAPAPAATPEAVTPAADPAQAAPAPEPTKVARPVANTRAARREREAARLAAAAAAKTSAAKAAATTTAAAPAPTPAPARRRDVLDFESNDAALEAALGSSKPTGSRSVYVPPPPSGATLQERVTDSQVNETILGRVSALQHCVQEQKGRDPDATGVLKMRWAIAPDGSVRDAKCVTPEYASSPIAQCVSGVLKATRFPKSKVGRQDVTFPIKF